MIRETIQMKPEDKVYECEHFKTIVCFYCFENASGLCEVKEKDKQDEK